MGSNMSKEEKEIRTVKYRRHRTSCHKKLAPCGGELIPAYV